MQKTRLSALPEAVRGFLADALKGDGLILEDDQGRPQGKLLPLKTEPIPRNGQTTQIPTWPGTVTSSLRREELYADV